MSKRPAVDLAALTAETAEPMREAAQRTAPGQEAAEIVPLSFKVPPAFARRFRRCAFEAGLKLNKLLFQALDAWEEQQRS